MSLSAILRKDCIAIRMQQVEQVTCSHEQVTCSHASSLVYPRSSAMGLALNKSIRMGFDLNRKRQKIMSYYSPSIFL
jgi:hypothetical protein